MKIDHVSVIGGRSKQEDRHVIDVREAGTLCAVLDGHNGADVAQTISEHLAPAFVEEPNIRLLFDKLQSIVQCNPQGSTCSLVWIPSRFRLTNIGVAILGDSPFIARTKSGIVIPPLHNVRGYEGAVQEAKNGGAIVAMGYALDPRTGDGCQVTRAFGDSGLSFMRHDPDLWTYEDVEWIVLATDGILDTHRIDIAAAREIIDAMDKGATATQLLPDNPSDNVTIITIRQ